MSTERQQNVNRVDSPVDALLTPNPLTTSPVNQINSVNRIFVSPQKQRFSQKSSFFPISPISTASGIFSHIYSNLAPLVSRQPISRPALRAHLLPRLPPFLGALQQRSPPTSGTQTSTNRQHSTSGSSVPPSSATLPQAGLLRLPCYTVPPRRPKPPPNSMAHATKQALRRQKAATIIRGNKAFVVDRHSGRSGAAIVGIRLVAATSLPS